MLDFQPLIASLGTRTHTERMPWVASIAIGLASALLCGLIARRVGLSPIVGYLLAGVLVGPHTPGFVGDVKLAAQLADVGVILLMFGVGLSFSLSDLWAVRRIALPGALLASTVTVALCGLVGQLAGFSPQTTLVFGLCFTSASTVVIVRGLIEADQLSSAAGRIAIGWSVVEDLIVVVVLVLLPTLGSVDLSAGGGELLRALGLALGRVLLLAVAVFGLGPLIVPRFLALVARAQSRELFTLAVLVLAIGTAFVASEYFGTSVALGAFLGGMLVGQSDSSHQAAADALPLRDAFAVLFFLAIGMLFDPAFVLAHPWLLCGCLAAVLVGKPLTALVVLLWRGYPLGPSLTVAAAVAQVSEFAFVLASLAGEQGLLPAHGRDAVLATVLLSITASPLLFRAARPLERWLLGRRAIARYLVRQGSALRHLKDGQALPPAGHAVLIGHGRVGSILAQFMDRQGLAYVVIEQDRAQVEALRQAGVPALFGDASSPVLLDRAGIAGARVLLVATPDPVVARLATEHAHRVNAEIAVIARVHLESLRTVLHRFPRTQGVHSEQELGLAMARLMLQEAAVIDGRREHPGALGGGTQILEIKIPERSSADGKQLSELGLPRGSLVITLTRAGEFLVPSGSTRLASGDALLVLTNLAMAAEIERLLQPAPKSSAGG
jgi:monovalent cation:H+ antiporter-2, CPA2 family